MHYGTEAADFVEGPERFLEAVSGRVEQLEASEADPRQYLNGDGTTVLVLQAPVRLTHAGSRRGALREHPTVDSCLQKPREPS